MLFDALVHNERLLLSCLSDQWASENEIASFFREIFIEAYSALCQEQTSYQVNSYELLYVSDIYGTLCFWQPIRHVIWVHDDNRNFRHEPTHQRVSSQTFDHPQINNPFNRSTIRFYDWLSRWDLEVFQKWSHSGFVNIVQLTTSLYLVYRSEVMTILFVQILTGSSFGL